MRNPLAVLYLEHEPADAALVVAELRKQWPDCDVDVVTGGAEFEEKFKKGAYDLVLATAAVPNYSGAQALAFVRTHSPDRPFILISGSCPEGPLLEAIQHGGTDYILRESLPYLGAAVTRALNEAEERSKLRAAEEALRSVELKYRTLFEKQKHATTELERREEYFRALTELGSDVIAVIGPNGNFRYLSSSVSRVLGYDPVLLLPRNAFELLHPEDQLIARDTVDRLVTTPGAIDKLELRVLHASGRWRDLEIVGRNLLADPNVAGIIISGRDVTERRIAEIRIREQAALLDNAQDAIMLCDLEGRLVFWSRSAERVYGWKPREALGEVADRLLFGPDTTRPVAAFKGLIAKGEWAGELTQINRNGEPIIVESRWSLVRSDAGEPRSILIINTDVTDTRKLQAQFLRAQRMESIGALAGGIAHDMNNILAPVLIAAELLKEKVNDPECQDWLKTLTDSAQRGADLVRQILSFARGTGEELVNLQMRHLISEHVKILKETFPRSIRIESVVDRTLWLVNGNATKLNQVLMNLSVNARDAMPAGGRIRFRARNLILDQLIGPAPGGLAPGAYVIISVADTGTGVPRAVMSRIFEPFFTTKDVTKGTGLGLATALGIVKSHSGALTVASEEGKGSQFDIYLPAVQSEAAEPSAPTPAPAPKGSGQCVLVVDDEAPTRELVCTSLQKHGYDVMSATDGSDGLQTFMANTGKIALVITDLEMPVMAGANLVHALRALVPSLRVVILSGLVAADPPQGLGPEPRTQLLEKPCSAEDLLKAVYRGLTAS